MTTSFLWDRFAADSGVELLVDDRENAYLHVDGLLAETDSANLTSYPLTDALGSVRGITAANETVIGSADYDVFGAIRVQSGVAGSFGFAGEQRDTVTGFTYLRARYLAPEPGRFLSADTVQPNAPGSQGFNRYSYVANNPTTWVDPSGHILPLLLALFAGLSVTEVVILSLLLVILVLQLAIQCHVNGYCLDSPPDISPPDLGIPPLTWPDIPSIDLPNIAPSIPWTGTEGPPVEVPFDGTLPASWDISEFVHNEGSLVNWLESMEEAFKAGGDVPTQGEMDDIFDEIDLYGLEWTGPEAHGPNLAPWDQPHIHVGNKRIHVPLPNGYVVPTK